MTYELPAPRGPIRDLMMQAGYIVGFSVQALVSVVLATVKRRLSVYEVVTQTLFIGRVCTGPSLLLMMPIGVFIAVSVGELAGRIGAGGYSGAVVAFIIVGQAAALVCALMMAGVAGAAICTDLGSRKIREEIDAMEVERKTQRARRQERQGLASVALVGYTNAGKSTLMRALTGSEVLVANKLFATLDTTVRVLHPEGIPRVLVSDTVGFIKNLPHGLVASFKSTLDEALDASLLLHVIDASDPGFERQLEVTDVVLAEIGADVLPRIRVFNKIDHVGDEAAQAECKASLQARYPDCVVMSARRPEEVSALREVILGFFQRDLVEAELFLPWSAQQLRGEIYENCEVLEERADEEGAVFSVRGERDTVEALSERFQRGG